jgi:RNA polymerase sigma-70 factor, ECF subfamily
MNDRPPTTVQSQMKTRIPPGPGEIAPAILDRARRGDQEAFAAVIRHYDRGLRSLAYRLLGDRDRMDDALQEAYMKAFRALPRFRGDSKLGTWLYRITYNVCLDELERSSRAGYVSLADIPEPVETGPPADETLSDRDALVSALDALAPEDRAAVLLVDADGFDYRAAGEILGVPAGTVASRLNRARAALRHTLSQPLEAAAQ